jgi:parallel beta-helix repeat protein
MRTKPRRTLAALITVAITITGFAMTPSAAAGITFYVDKSNPQCSNSGSGSSTVPFCSINASADRAGPGDTVLVRTGTYSEHVELSESGTTGAPIVFQPAPGANVLVTGGENAFEFPNVDWVTIRGFRVTNTSNHAIYISDSSNITVDGLDVSGAGNPVSGQTARGVYVSDTVDSLIVNNVVHDNSDSGIHLKGTTTRIEIRGNNVFQNAREYERAAPGIDLRATGNTVVNNVSHHNEDSGIQIYTSARNNLIVNNLAYDNGDHGIDVLRASGQRIIGNTIYRNDTAGINLEGGSTSGSTGGTLANNISVDNALNSTRTRGNIRVDAASITGTTINFDHVWLSSPGVQIVWGNNSYNTLSAFRAAVSQEARGLESNPQFKNPAEGDFHLKAGSLAIDSANSGASGQRATDLEGRARLDDPSTTNTGAGTRTYDDRGAYEFKAPSPPVAMNDQVATVEDIGLSISVLSNDSDPDGGTLRVSGLADPPHGTAVVGSTNTISYVPDQDFFGTDTFIYSISNSAGLGASAQVTVAIGSVNDPPAAQGDQATTRQGTPVVIDVLANDTDVEGHPLSISQVTSPAHGEATTGTMGRITYRPAPGYIGPDSFTYTVVDGQGGSATAQVSITVAASTPPNVVDDAVEVDEDTAEIVDVLANDSDPDGDAVTIEQVEAPTHGSAVINGAGSITYTPAPNYNGPDSFTYTGRDPGGATDTAAVSVEVNPVNDAPSAANDAETVPAAKTSTFDVLGNDTDIDGNDIDVASVTAPAHGSAAVDPSGLVTYTPASGYEGPDTFNYTLSDGAGGSATGRVDLKVDAVPVARISASPASGSAPLTVTANASASTDTALYPIATYRFSFGDGTVIGPQASPTASHTLTSSGDFPVRVTVTDTAGLASTKTTLVRVSRELVGNRGFETSTTGWAGSPTGVTVTRSLTSPHSGLQTGKVTNTLASPTSCTLNDSPNWAISSQAGTYRASMWVRAGVVGSELKLRIREYAGAVLAGSQVATIDLTNNWQLVSLTYTPVSPEASTIDLNAFVSSAPTGTCFFVDDVSLTHVGVVEESSAPPDAIDDAVLGDEDTPKVIDVLENDLDADGDPLIVTHVTAPAHGTATINESGTVEYAPSANYNGPDEFDYTVKDPGGSTDSARVSIGVAPVNDAPTAVNDDRTTPMNTSGTFSVLGNDLDVDGDPLTVTSTTTPGHGSAALHPNGTITYTPAGGFQGTDSFQYTISDGAGGTASATVNVSVTTGTTELVGNTGFESSLSGWVGSAGTQLSRGTTDPHSGSWWGALNNNLSTATSCTLNDSPNWVLNTQEGTYTASMWVRAWDPLSPPIKMRLREYVGSTAVGMQVETFPLTTTWQKVTVSYTIVSPGASTLDFNAYVSNAPTGTCFFVDDISITRQ